MLKTIAGKFDFIIRRYRVLHISSLICLTILFVLGGTLLAAKFDRKAIADDGPIFISQEKIPPEKAYLVFTKESWGCLLGQEIVADVTDDLNVAEENPVFLEEVKNPEDINNRLELYLYFPAQKISGFPGYYVLKLGVQGGESQVPESMYLVKAYLLNQGQDLSFSLKAANAGRLKTDLLFAGDTQLVSGLFTCASAGLFEANSTQYFPSYPIKTETEFTVMKVDSQWYKVTIPIEDFYLEEAEALSTCYGLLTKMEKKFSISNEHLFLWDRSRLTSNELDLIVSSLEKEQNLRFYVNIELEAPSGITQIQRDPEPFLPQMRQVIAAKNAKGKVTGGSVTIAVEKADPK